MWTVEPNEQSAIKLNEADQQAVQAAGGTTPSDVSSVS